MAEFCRRVQFMKIICDMVNKKFALENCYEKDAETCVAILNDAVSVPQIINLSFKDVAFDLKDRPVYFGLADGVNPTTAVQNASKNILAQLGVEQIHCVVLNLAVTVDITFEKIEQAVQELTKVIPDSIVHFGVVIDKSLISREKAFIIVSE